MTEWIRQAFEILFPFVGTALGAAILYLCIQAINYLKEKNVEEEIIEALRQAVDDTQENYVDWWKAASADGKLSKEERQQALGIAKQTAMRLLKGPAKEVAFTWSIEKINSIIRRILESKQKAEPITIIEEHYEDVDDILDADLETPVGGVDGADVATANRE